MKTNLNVTNHISSCTYIDKKDHEGFRYIFNVYFFPLNAPNQSIKTITEHVQKGRKKETWENLETDEQTDRWTDRE